MEMSEYRFNVAQLLQELVGATRRHELDDDYLDLDDGQRVRDISGHIRLTTDPEWGSCRCRPTWKS